jgi:hypothetical protein
MGLRRGRDIPCRETIPLRQVAWKSTSCVLRS